MEAVSTLIKWGNSQGIYVTKSVCDRIGAKVGDRANIQIQPDNSLRVSFVNSGYRRRKQVSIDDLFRGSQSIHTSSDPWGDDMGAEVVE